MRIAVVDDEVKWQASAEALINIFPWENVPKVDVFSSGSELCRADVYDVVFMDVEMPNMDGFEAARLCHEKNKETIIIFLTTHMELCNRGYMINAFRYINKDYIVAEMQEALEAVADLWNRKSVLKCHLIQAGDYEIPLGEILYIETEKRNVVIHTKTQKYNSNRTMDDLEKELKDQWFFRCHKSYLVNLENIQKMDELDVYFENGERAMISVRNRSELKRKHMEYRFRYANS